MTAWSTKGIPKPRWETGPDCTGCPFRKRSFGFAPPAGIKLITEEVPIKTATGPTFKEYLEGWDFSTVKAKIALIGEALGSVEVATGWPFQGGAAGSLATSSTKRTSI